MENSSLKRSSKVKEALPSWDAGATRAQAVSWPAARVLLVTCHWRRLPARSCNRVADAPCNRVAGAHRRQQGDGHPASRHSNGLHATAGVSYRCREGGLVRRLAGVQRLVEGDGAGGSVSWGVAVTSPEGALLASPLRAMTRTAYSTPSVSRTYRVVASYGTGNTAQSPPVTIEWRTLSVVITADTPSPDAGASNWLDTALLRISNPRTEICYVGLRGISLAEAIVPKSPSFAY